MHLEEIREKSSYAFLNKFQKEFLSSIHKRMSDGKNLTEKQEKILSETLRYIGEVESSGVWKVSDKEKFQIDCMLKISQGYSNFYLTNYKPHLSNTLANLLNIHERVLLGSQLFNKEREVLERCKSFMKNKIMLLENPKFSPGDLCKYAGEIGLVLEGPSVGNHGEITYRICVGYAEKSVTVKSLSKQLKI